MSNRSAYNRRDINQGSTKTHQKFVPKTTPNWTRREPDTTNPTLTSSLRKSFSKEQIDDVATSSSSSSGGGVSSASSSRTSRVKLGDCGNWIPSKINGGNFVNYLPQDEAVAAGLGVEQGGLDPLESQRVVDLLNRELSQLLKLKARDFWREVASDTSLHDFLDSFLQFRSRWYDFPHHGAKGIVAGVIVGESGLSRRVFMVLYRISSNRDPGARSADSLSLNDHEVLLQEKKLLDLPKLLDICAIYGHENEELTRSLVMNAFKSQPTLYESLPAVMSHFLDIIQTMHQRCNSTLEVLFASGGFEEDESSQIHKDYLEVMDFINDAIVCMDAFVSAYKPAAVFFSCPVETSFGNEELLTTLTRLHDLLLPSLQRGLRIILSATEAEIQEKLSSVSISLKLLLKRIISFGWKLMDCCYLSDEAFEEGGHTLLAGTKMFPANIEDPLIRADILVQTLRDINGVSQQSQEIKHKGTFLQNIEKNYKMIDKLKSLQNNGWLVMDDEQRQYVSGLMIDPLKPIFYEPSSGPATIISSKIEMDEDSAISESKISQIKDLFPNYGKGFLSACLEAYNQNPEEVIQRILEGNLHEDLKSLDTSLEKIPPPKSVSSVSRNDKGKGKLLEFESTAPPPSFKSNGPSVSSIPATSKLEGPSLSSSSSAVGRYVRKSKTESLDSETLDSRNADNAAKISSLVSQYEYEDEYDDSFDDLGTSVVGLGSEETEILREKISSNPGKSWGDENENSAPIHPPNSKWNSHKKPQFYVKDGKNYSYKVADSVAVANFDEASLVNQAQKELIHGLGRGGNIPLGAVKKLTESNKDEEDDQSDANTEARGRGSFRGRGRRGGGGRGGRNNYRKDQAMKKHFSGMSGY